MRRINVLLSTPVYCYDGSYYLSRPFFFNELVKEFGVTLFTKVEHLTTLDLSCMSLLDDSIEIKDFFQDQSLSHALYNFRIFRKKIKGIITLRAEELFLVLYPVRSIDLLFCKLLSKAKTIIWVKIDPVEEKLNFLQRRLKKLCRSLLLSLNPFHHT